MMTRAQVLRKVMKSLLVGRRCSCGGWKTREPHTGECPVGVAYGKALETWGKVEEERKWTERLGDGAALLMTNHGYGG